MTRRPCLTVDVESWYDGMRALGHEQPVPTHERSGIDGLVEMLSSRPQATVTLFVVGNYAERVESEVTSLLAAGHELASHGPDHGHLPGGRRELVGWLKAGRAMLEDLFQTEVHGMRSPRFSLPPSLGLDVYRELLAEAGFRYVSDRSRLGDGSPIDELPVLQAGRVPVGGGSYQRLLPRQLVSWQTGRAEQPAVLYYHSYDFGATLPTARSTRSIAVAKQVIGRRRAATMFRHILDTHGSETCSHARSAL